MFAKIKLKKVLLVAKKYKLYKNNFSIALMIDQRVSEGKNFLFLIIWL